MHHVAPVWYLFDFQYITGMLRSSGIRGDAQDGVAVGGDGRLMVGDDNDGGAGAAVG